MRTKRLHERPGVGRLGRHVEHDPASRAFAHVAAPRAPRVSKRWARHCDPFNQGDLGSCTANAVIGACMTDPIWRPGLELDEVDAVELYKHATRLDRIAGHYPPDDTGSTGLAACKAAVRAGLLSGYAHAFSLGGMLSALQSGPVVIGIQWYEAFDTPVGLDARLVIGGDARGGHEVEINEIDVERRLVRGPNSWGVDWGDQGYFTIGWNDLERLLDEDGDCTKPLR